MLASSSLGKNFYPGCYLHPGRLRGWALSSQPTRKDASRGVDVALRPRAPPCIDSLFLESAKKYFYYNKLCSQSTPQRRQETTTSTFSHIVGLKCAKQSASLQRNDGQDRKANTPSSFDNQVIYQIFFVLKPLPSDDIMYTHEFIGTSLFRSDVNVTTQWQPKECLSRAPK